MAGLQRALRWRRAEATAAERLLVILCLIWLAELGVWCVVWMAG